MYTDKVLASASGDSTLKVWDLETGNCLRTLKGHTDEVICMKLNGNRLVSGSSDHSVRIWDIAVGKCERTLRGHSDWVYSLDMQGNHIYSASWDGSLRIWEIDDQAVKKPFTSGLSSGPSSPSITPRFAQASVAPSPTPKKKPFYKKF
jgi:WD40 repeat protein